MAGNGSNAAEDECMAIQILQVIDFRLWLSDEDTVPIVVFFGFNQRLYGRAGSRLDVFEPPSLATSASLFASASADAA